MPDMTCADSIQQSCCHSILGSAMQQGQAHTASPGNHSSKHCWSGVTRLRSVLAHMHVPIDHSSVARHNTGLTLKVCLIHFTREYLLLVICRRLNRLTWLYFPEPGRLVACNKSVQQQLSCHGWAEQWRCVPFSCHQLCRL